MKSKENSSRISLTKSLGSDDCKSNIHNPNLNCDIASTKSSDEFPTPIIFPITSNVLMHDNLMPQKKVMKISTKICKKLHKQTTYFKWKHEHIEKLEHLMKKNYHCSLKTIANIFYKHNIHPMLNTQKIHYQFKRLRKSQKKKKNNF
jgi:ABC-type uncharacterized transport system permease subunit